MPTFPSSLKYQANYRWSFSPDVIRTQYVTNNTRQRFIIKKTLDEFDFVIRGDCDDVEVFENFVNIELENGGLTYDANYFVSTIEENGTFQILGDYRVQQINHNLFDISFTAQLLDRTIPNPDLLYFDDTFWGSPIDLAWSGTAWESTASSTTKRLNRIGAWSDPPFRPLVFEIRLTVVNGSFPFEADISLLTDNFDEIARIQHTFTDAADDGTLTLPISWASIPDDDYIDAILIVNDSSVDAPDIQSVDFY